MDTQTYEQGGDIFDQARELFRAGNVKEALDLIQQLAENGSDGEDRLSRAEHLLKEEENPEFVGKVAWECLRQAERGPREQALINGAQEWAARKLERLRGQLGRGYLADAMAVAGDVMALTPWHAGNHLEAALPLLEQLQKGNLPHERPTLISTDGPLITIFGGRSRGQNSTNTVMQDVQARIEELLEAVLHLSTPETGMWRTAALKLITLYRITDRYGSAYAALENARTQIGGADRELEEAEKELAAAALGNIMGRAAMLMRLGQLERAADLLERVLPVATQAGVVWIMIADLFHMQGRSADAEAIFRWLQGHQAEALSKTCKAICEQAGLAAEIAALTCPTCDQSLQIGMNACPRCSASIPDDVLLVDRYALEGINPAYMAAAGRIDMLLALGCPLEAFDLLEELLKVGADLGAARRPLESLHDRLEPQQAYHAFDRDIRVVQQHYEAGRPIEAAAVAERLATASHVDDRPLAWLSLAVAENVADGMRAHIQRAAVTVRAATWHQMPLAGRLKLGHAVVQMGWQVESRSLIPYMFSPQELADVGVRDLIEQAEQERQRHCEHLLEEALEMLSKEQPDRAARLAEQVLRLEPDSPRAILIHSRARLAEGGVYPAAEGFRKVLRLATPGSPISRDALLGLARCYLWLDDLPEATRLLGELLADRPVSREAGVDQTLREADDLLHEIERRQEGQPAIRVTRITQHASRGKVQNLGTGDPSYQAVFAVVVRATGRRVEKSHDTVPLEEIARAGSDFVATLGGLAGKPGNAAFDLRMITEPGVDEHEGHLRVALLCRVTHNIPEAAELHALEVWDRLRLILPLARQSLYQYEPVYSEAELEGLLSPFEIGSSSEVLRQEEVINGAYAVRPFSTGGTTLHGLASLLLNHPHPAMVSVYLQPTYLSKAEQQALHRNYKALRQMRMRPPSGPHQEDDIGLGQSDEFSIAMPDGRQITLIEMYSHVQEALERSAYVLRIRIASPERGIDLLTHAIVTEMFGPGGRYTIEQTTTSDQLAVACHNLSQIDAGEWTSSRAPRALRRLRTLAGSGEASLFFRLPVPGPEGLPGMAQIAIKAVPPQNLPASGLKLGESVVTEAGRPQIVYMRQQDRRRHLYVVGKTGVGKSTLLEVMALQDIEAGRGVAVLDPHGDLVESLLTHIPLERAHDVVVFDPADEERPVGLNFLQATTDSQRHRIATEFIDMLMKMYDPHQQGIVGPRFQHNVRMAMLTTMLADPQATLLEVVLALSNKRYIKALRERITDPVIASYWDDQIANTNDFHKSEILDYIVSKFNRFVGDRLVRHIVGQSQSTLDFRAIMDERKVLLVNLSKGKIGPESASFLGYLMIQKLMMATLSRADQEKEHRDDFCLYVDEFQTFATDSFANMLSEGRKYGLCLVMANQYVSQLPPALREAVFGNVGSLVSFQVGTQDAIVMYPHMQPVFTVDDLVNIPRYTAVAKLLVDGQATRPFAMRTRLDGRLPDPERARAIKQASRLRYGRDAGAVSREIDRRFMLREKGILP